MFPLTIYLIIDPLRSVSYGEVIARRAGVGIPGPPHRINLRHGLFILGNEPRE